MGAAAPLGKAGTARLFVALEPDPRSCAALAAWGAQTAAADAALRALPAASLHLTLHFLGARPEPEIPALADAVESAGSGVRAPLALILAGALWLAPRRPHVLACAAADDGGELAALQLALAAPLAAATDGWHAETRPFRPHITLARVRRGARPSVGSEPAAPELRGRAAALTLLRSHLGPSGTRYEPLRRVALP